MIKKVITMRENVTIQKAIEILHDRHVGSIVIVDDDEKCLGIFTERDAIRTVATNIPLTSRLQRVMSRNVITIREDASYAKAKSLFATYGIRHLPTVDERDRLIGILSIRSILDELL